MSNPLPKRRDDGPDLLANLSRDLGSRKKLSIAEFAELCGKNLYPRQLLILKLIMLEDLTPQEEDVLDYWIAGGRGGAEIVISPMIRERMAWLKANNYEHFREVVLVGGRRSGKGHMTAILGAYMMYNMLDVDVMDEFNIDADHALYFSCIAASQDQAKAAQYADFASTVSACPAMQEYIFKIRELEFSVLTEYDKRRTKELEARMGRIVGRDMSKLRGVAMAANAKTVRGLAHIFSCLDEMAHMQQEGTSYMTATAVYDALSPSLLQFGRHSLCMMNSSPYTKVGKFYQKFLEAMKLNDDGKPSNYMMFALQYPSWSPYEGYNKVPNPIYRKVEMASPDWDENEIDEKGNLVYSPEDIDAILLARNEEQSDPVKFKVENRSNWAEVLDAFLQPEIVDRAFMGRPKGDGYEDFKVNWAMPVAGYEYFCHLDPSSTTAGFGFVMAHTEPFPETTPKGELIYEDHVVVDIVKRWLPKNFLKEGQGVDMVFDYEWVLDEIAHWIAIFRPTEITLDQFGAPVILAWLNRWCKENDMTNIRIFEKTATAKANYSVAMRFRDALTLDRVHIPSDTPDCDWLALELKNLQIVNSQGGYARIDCPTVGPVQTKDIYSALSQVVYSLIGDTTVRNTRDMLATVKPILGAEGGYSIGGSTLQRRSLLSIRPELGDKVFYKDKFSPQRESVNRGNWMRKGRRY